MSGNPNGDRTFASFDDLRDSIAPAPRIGTAVADETDVLRISAGLMASDLPAARTSVVGWIGEQTDLPASFADADAFDHVEKDRRFEVATAERGGMLLWGARVGAAPASGGGGQRPRWSAEIVVASAENVPHARLVVRVRRASASSVSSDMLALPSFFLRLARQVPLLQAGQRLVPDARVIDTETDVRGLGDWLANPSRRRAAIVLSVPEDRSAPLLDPLPLARAVLGFGEVFVLPFERAFDLSDRFGKRLSVYMGAVRVYRPGFTDHSNPFDHPLFLQGRDESDEAFARGATRSVLQIAAEEALKLENDLPTFAELEEAPASSRPSAEPVAVAPATPTPTPPAEAPDRSPDPPQPPEPRESVRHRAAPAPADPPVEPRPTPAFRSIRPPTPAPAPPLEDRRPRPEAERQEDPPARRIRETTPVSVETAEAPKPEPVEAVDAEPPPAEIERRRPGFGARLKRWLAALFGRGTPQPDGPSEDHGRLLEAEERAAALGASLEELQEDHLRLKADFEEAFEGWENAERERDAAISRLQEIERRIELDVAQARREEAEADAGLPTAWSDFGDWCDRELVGRVRLMSRARRELKNARFEDVALAARCLNWLATDYRDGKQPGRGAGVRKPQESGVRNEPCGGDQFSVKWRGRNREVEWHLKNGGNSRDPRRCLRIYYFYDKDSREVVVAWMPSHRRTEAT